MLQAGALLQIQGLKVIKGQAFLVRILTFKVQIHQFGVVGAGWRG